jgi:Raf kinase inhibitor-like YbhB/YbcL family protein
MNTIELLVTPLGWALRRKRAGLEHSVRNAPELDAPQTIPKRHSAPVRGQNISPALRWHGLPAGTRQLMLIIEDSDAPLPRPSLHMIALLPPGPSGLDEGVLTPGNLAVRYIPARNGRVGYSGPHPMPGHGLHHYGFHLYALDRDVPTGMPIASLDELLPLVRGHVLASGFVEGVQQG